MLFNVTYEIVTPESAEEADVDEHGYIQAEATLREALTAVWDTRTSHVDGILSVEVSDRWCDARWVTVNNGMEFLTSAYESRSLHFPEELTGATRKRIIRLVRGGHI
jgi:hypothetical protein